MIIFYVSAQKLSPIVRKVYCQRSVVLPNELDEIVNMHGGERLLFGLALEKALLKKREKDFQKFFVDAANTLWGADFEPWKPQGRIGDFKCDGYLVSKKTVFQCYAPAVFRAAKVTDKIQSDFAGAYEHFGEKMERWVFVHNQDEGLPAAAGMLLTELRKQHPGITIQPWGPNELIRRLGQLPNNQLGKLFPELIADVSFNEATIDILDAGIKDYRARTAEIAATPGTQVNRLALDDALDRFDMGDRDVRRRLLGYSRWYDPATRAEIDVKLAQLGYGAPLIELNAQRLHDAGLIRITESHYLPLNDEICQQAAETLVDEFLRELEE